MKLSQDISDGIVVGKIFYLFYFTNGRYIECLSLTNATNKSKTKKKEEREKRTAL